MTCHVLFCGLLASVPAVVSGSIPPVQFAVEFQVCRGDPLGSRAAGTLKCVAEPTVVTPSGQEAVFRAGNEVTLKADGKFLDVFVGVRAEIVPVHSADGKILVGMSSTYNSLVAGSGLQSSATRHDWSAKPGEVFKVRLDTAGPEEQVWVEVIIRAAGEKK